MKKLPISIGILAWKSGQTLVDTLTTYYANGLFEISNDITILFQEFSHEDYQIAKHFGLDSICLNKNIGIGMGLLRLANVAQSDNVLLLEHDWKLIEDKEITEKYYPEKFKLLTYGKMYYYEFIPIIPCVNLELINNWKSSLN